MHVVPAFTLRLRVQVHSNRIFPLGVQTDARSPIESSGLEVVSFSSIKTVKPEYGCEQCQVQELWKEAGDLSEPELGKRATGFLEKMARGANKTRANEFEHGYEVQ